MLGGSCGTIEARFRGFRINLQAPSVLHPQRPSCLLRFRNRYIMHISRSDKGMLIVVPKWCPTLQNHAVTGYAALFAGFEKMPISCGFAPSSHETICRLMTADLAIQAIKNSRIALVAWDAHIPQPPHKYSFLALCVPILVGLKCCLTLF